MSKVLSQTATFQIRAVTSPADSELFLDVPAHVYANDPNWIAPLRSDIAKQFAPTQILFLSMENYRHLLPWKKAKRKPKPLDAS